MKKKLLILLLVLITMSVLLKYLDLKKEINELNDEVNEIQLTLINENKESELKYNDLLNVYESEISKEKIISENRLNTIDDYINRVTNYENEVSELKESVKLLSDTEYYLMNLNLYGITSDMVLQDLSSHPELIPFDGVLGGTMCWSVTESYLLTDRYVFAQFNDGHYMGHALLSFEIVNNNFTWTLYEAKVFNDDLTGLIALGKSVYSDLNGDGDYESINYDLDDLRIGTDSWRHIIKDDVYNNNPHKEKYILVDIDTKDLQKEIGLLTEGPSSDYETHFYSYDGLNLLEIGSVPFLVENLKDQLDEDGNIYGYMRLSVMQTWFAKSRWTMIDNKLIHNPDPLFDVSSDQIHNLKVALPIYKDMGDEKSNTVMAPQEVKFLLTDNLNWCKLEGEDGSTGWFKIEDFYYLPDLKLNADQVFDNLSFAD